MKNFNEKNKNNTLKIVLIALIFFLFLNLVINRGGTETPSYNQFLKDLDAGKITKIEPSPDLFKLQVTALKKGTIKKQGSSGATGNTKNTRGSSKNTKVYVIGYPGSPALEEITQKALKKNVEIKSKPTPTGNFFSNLLLTLLPVAIILGFLFFFMSKGVGGGGLPFSKTTHRRYMDSGNRVTFKDVAGVDEALEEVMEVKEFLSSPQKFKKLGAKVPRGVLLYGPPGTGKTLIAKSVAHEAGVPFFSASGSGFHEIFVGVGGARIRDLFQEARENAPSIIFIDEIDSVGRNRANNISTGHDEQGQTLNELLSQMDGFGSDENVIVFAATNRLDVLDPALTRPGRFDRQIMVDRPDSKGREAILHVHTRGKPLDDKVNFKTIAMNTPGFTGADIANLINEAAILAARLGHEKIMQEDIQEAILRVITGPEKKSRLLNEKERKITAYHEVGHALVGHYLPNTDPVHKISIVGRGQALGYTLSLPEEDTFLATKEDMMDKMAMTLGGRAAEQIVFNSITTGASNDLEKVTADAKNIVMRYAMIPELGMRTFNQDENNGYYGGSSGQDYSESLSVKIDQEIQKLTEEAYAVALNVLNDHREELEIISEHLIVEENISKEKFEEMLKPFIGKPINTKKNKKRKKK